jgi:hypothetical protein
MDIGSIFLILALLVMVGLFISRPLFERKETATDVQFKQQEHQRSALLAERDRLLNALQELDFDYALGKIPEEDYPQQRAILMQRGADTLRQLDAVQPEGKVEDAEARLEAAIAAHRADAGRSAVLPNGRKQIPAAVAVPDDDLEIMLANRRRVRQEKATGFCPQCGGPVHKSDRFCPKCGAKIV